MNVPYRPETLEPGDYLRAIARRWWIIAVSRIRYLRVRWWFWLFVSFSLMPYLFTGIILYFSIATIWITGLQPLSMEKRDLNLGPQGETFPFEAYPERRRVTVQADVDSGNIEIVSFLTKGKGMAVNQIAHEDFLAQGNAKVELTIPPNEPANIWIRPTHGNAAKLKVTIASFRDTD